MIRNSGLFVIALFAFVFFFSVNSQAIKINDDYIGSDDHGYGDVIGNENVFCVDWLDVTITGNEMKVDIKTCYGGFDSLGAGTEYGDFFVSTDGWNPYGSAPYLADDHANGENWEYAFDVQTGNFYDITGAQSNIRLSQHTMPSSGYVFRNGQETAIDTTGLTPFSTTEAGVRDPNGPYFSFSIDLKDLNWNLSDLGFHWAAATCANDVIEGSAAPLPEPASLVLFGTGLVGLAGFSRKKRFKK
jgi:hypothetical protein